MKTNDKTKWIPGNGPSGERYFVCTDSPQFVCKTGKIPLIQDNICNHGTDRPLGCCLFVEDLENDISDIQALINEADQKFNFINGER